MKPPGLNPTPDNWPDVAGALLAGGSGQRMTGDKAWLTIGAEPLWRRSVSVLEDLFSRVLIAGNRPDLASDKFPCYPDSSPGSALGGLETALTHAGREWVCILPCDLPFPSPNLLKCLLDRRQGVQAVVPRGEYANEPLVACYHQSCLGPVRDLLSEGNLRVTALLERVDTRLVEHAQLPSGWRRALRNLNVPADLEKLKHPPPAVTFVARSGTGKTTLLEKLIAVMVRRGWTVGALKHDVHNFEIDHEGKDSWRLTRAGATLTAISSPEKSALVRRHEREPSAEELLRDFIGMDLVVTEGFKRSALPKIEIHRAALGDPLLCRVNGYDPTLIAIVSDTHLPVDVPCFDLADISALADFLEKRLLAVHGDKSSQL